MHLASVGRAAGVLHVMRRVALESWSTLDDVARHERTVGRYALFGQIGAGGMAAVHLGRRLGPAGFSRLVAIKRLHPHLVKDRAFSQAFYDEARIAARVSHPSVVSIHDVVMEGDEALLVMEYVMGASLATVLARGAEPVPPPVAIAIAVDMLHGLHAAHEARDEAGRPLDVVHRDVSPQNVLVGTDGVTRVLDFGIAKAARRLQETETGAVKGKLAYMAPERLEHEEATRSVDVFGAGVVVWEMLAGERYYGSSNDPGLVKKVLACEYRHLAAPSLSRLDGVLEGALARDPAERHATAMDLANALERIQKPASRAEVTAWLRAKVTDVLDEAAAMVEEIERTSVPPPVPSARTARTEDTSPSTTTRAVVKDDGRQEGGPKRVAAIGAAVVVAIGAFALATRATRTPAASAAPAVATSSPPPVEAPSPVVTAATPLAPPAASSVPARPPATRVPAALPTGRVPTRNAADAGPAPRPPVDPEAPADRK